MRLYGTKQALLGNCIDYAGTFPPAALSFDDALNEAATFRSELRHPWLYSKMALPMELLRGISAKTLSDHGSDGTPWLFTALGTPVPDDTDRSEFARILAWDLKEIGRFNRRGFESAFRHWTIAYETKLPEKGRVASSKEEILHFMDAALARFSMTPHAITPFFEVPLENQNGEKSLHHIADALLDWSTSHEESPVPGLKFRTGGKQTPSTPSLAAAVLACTSRGLRFKATQGLHHAISGKSGFGFVNLFVSLAFAQALGEEKFGKRQVESCLDSSKPSDFSFGEATLKWKEYELEIEALEAARRKHGACFGSCSLKEPDEFLTSEFLAKEF